MEGEGDLPHSLWEGEGASLYIIYLSFWAEWKGKVITLTLYRDTPYTEHALRRAWLAGLGEVISLML